MSENAPAPAVSALQVALLFLVLVLAGGTWYQGARAREAAEEALKESRAASKAAAAAEEASTRAAAEAGELRADLDVLAGNLGSVERNLRDLAEEVKYGGGLGGGGLGGGEVLGGDPGGADAPPAQPMLEYTPELKESLRKAVAAKGVTLLEDRVSVPAEVVLRQGQLEFLAVLPQGKVHESIFVVTGKRDAEGAVPGGLAAALNSCLMALGLKPGTPLRVLPGGRVLPARGTTVHLSVEWAEDGERVRVRACDLLWDRERSRTLEEGKFLYVGSFFDPDGYVPDLAGDIVAVYSVPTCVVDLGDPRAANDTIFLACGPRIPAVGTRVDLVFSREPLEPTRTWDPERPAVRTDPGAPPPPAEAPEEEGAAEEEDDGGGGGAGGGR